MEWFWEPVPVDELPPGWKGPIPKIRVLEVVEQSSSKPLAVKKGQFVLVRVAYNAPMEGDVMKGDLDITADGWDTIQVPLKLSLGDIQMSLSANNLIPVTLSTQPNQSVEIDFKLVCRKLCVGGPAAGVTLRISPYQLHSGVKLVTAGPDGIHRQSFHLGDNDINPIFSAEHDAPLGPNTLFLMAASNTPLFRQSFAIPIKIIPDPL